MQDIINSIKAYLYDRAASPLMGAFLVSWAVINYRFWLILFADAPIDEKFMLIDKYYWGNVSCFVHRIPFLENALGFWKEVVVDFCEWIPRAFLHGFLYPAALTLFYLYVYPSIAKPVLTLVLKNEEEMLKEQKLAKGKRLLSEEDSAEIMAQIEVLGEAHKRKLDELKVEEKNNQEMIEDQRNVIKEKMSKIDSMRIEDSVLKGSLNNFLFLYEDEIVRRLQDFVTDIDVFQKIDLDYVIGGPALEKFRKIGLSPSVFFERICSENKQRSLHKLQGRLDFSGKYISLPACLKRTIEGPNSEGFFEYLRYNNYKNLMPEELESFFISHDPIGSYSLSRELLEVQFLQPYGSNLFSFDKKAPYNISVNGMKILEELMNSNA